MLIELTKLEGMDIGALDEGVKVGVVKSSIIDPEEVCLVGILVRIGTIIQSFKVASFQDVIDIDKTGVVIGSEADLLEKDDIVRIKKLLKFKYSLVGSRVRASGTKKSLGRVADAVIETTTGDVLRVYVSNLFKRRIFERSQIEKITLTEVIVKDIEPKAVKQKVLAAEKVAEIA